MARVCFHPTQPFLVAACADRRVALWHLDAPEEAVKGATVTPGKLVCPHDAGWVRTVAFSPNGKQILTGGSDRRVKVWSWSDGKPGERPEGDIQAHDGWVEAIACSPDGKRIVSGGADAAVKVWGDDLSAVKTLAGHSGFVRDVAWTPDGKVFVSGGEDGRVIVWDAGTLERLRLLEFGDTNEQAGQNPNVSGVHRLAISRDSRWLAAIGGAKLTIFDLTSGLPVVADRLEMQVAFSPTTDVVLAGSDTVRAWVYDAAKFVPGKPDKKGVSAPTPGLPGKEIGSAKLGGFSLGLAFSTDGKRVALGRTDGKVELWELS